MANPKFFGCDLSVPTYSWSAGTNASYPVTNLKNYFPDIKSKSAATTAGQSFVIDMGSDNPRIHFHCLLPQHKVSRSNIALDD